MSRTSPLTSSGAAALDRAPARRPGDAPLRRFREALAQSRRMEQQPVAPRHNVGRGERIASVAAGAALAALGAGRRDPLGALLATVGGALVLRGATGRCALYRAVGVNTAGPSSDRSSPAEPDQTDRGVHVVQSLLINKSPEELYAFWKDFEQLPRFMSHLKSVRRVDDRRSHWVAKAPAIVGGEVQWDAEITADVPNSQIAWRTVDGADVAHSGSVTFVRALGDRGTAVRVEMRYDPPAGSVGRWAAKLFGEQPEQQIRDDLRAFKRIMEIGEVISIEGQPRGACRAKR